MNPEKPTDSNKNKPDSLGRKTDDKASWQLGLVIALGVLTILLVATTAYFGSPFGYRMLLPH